MNTRTMVIIFLFIGVVLAGGIYYTTQEDAAYIDVQVNLTQLDNKSAPRVDNLTAKLVPTTKVSEPKGNPNFYAPGILVQPLMDAEIIGRWTSVPYNGTGQYNLKVGLTKYPQKGDFVMITIRLMDDAGAEGQSLTYYTQLE